MMWLYLGWMTATAGEVGLAEDGRARTLQEEVHAAEAELAECAVRGCPRATGAEAAWLLALHTYVASGVADGHLAATVRALDPALFAELPSVVQRAASEPLPWATWVGGAPAQPDVVPTAYELEPASAAPPRVAATRQVEERPGRAVSLTVEVVDENGRPIPYAAVRIFEEGERHRVDPETGRWTGSAMFLPDGTERAFDKGQRLWMAVFAPGYEYQRSHHTLSRRRNEVTHQLNAWQPSPHEDEAGLQVAQVAVDAWQQLVEAEAAYVDAPSQEAEAARASRLHRAAMVAREWMDAGGRRHANEMCLTAGSIPLCGDIPDRMAPEPEVAR